MAGHQLEDENDWVVVKKQKITILVPPASPVQSTIISSRTKQLQSKSEKVDGRSHNSAKRSMRYSKAVKKQSSGNCSPHESQKHQERVQAFNMQPATYPPEPNGGILLAATSVKFKGTCNHIPGEPVLQQCSIPHVVDEVDSAVSCRDRFFSAYRFSENVRDGQRLLAGALPVLNQRLRASNLEKRLERLGGLRRYLASLGLNKFIRLFEREKIGKFQLVNLTMSKLKDMGADAVGPRRKLLYAIDSLCQPYLKVS